MAASPAPGLVLAFMLGLAIVWLVPLTGWILLAGARTRQVRVWYGGLLAYGVGSLVFVISPSMDLPALLLLPGACALACVLLMTQSLRLELQPHTGGWQWLWLVPAYLLVQGVLFEQGKRPFEGVLLQQAALTFALLRLLWHVTQLWRREPGRGLLFIATGTSLWAIMSLLRTAWIFETGSDPGLLALDGLSNLLFICSVISPIFWGLGYWGFILERRSHELAKAQERSRSDMQRRQLAEEYGRKLETVVHERDHMIMLNSQFSAIHSLALLNAGIVHEISQPLASLSLCLSELDAMLLAPQHDAPLLRERVASAKHLNKQVMYTLNALRPLVTGAHSKLEPVAICDAVREVMDVARGECRLHGIELTLESPEDAQWTVQAQRVLLQRVLLNLLGNALHALASEQAPPDGRRIEVRLWRVAASAYQPSRTELSVSDNGPGLPPGLSERIGQLLPSSRAQGSGMGLALVRVMVEQWGGALAVESPPQGLERGTLIKLTFEG